MEIEGKKYRVEIFTKKGVRAGINPSKFDQVLERVPGIASALENTKSMSRDDMQKTFAVTSGGTAGKNLKAAQKKKTRSTKKIGGAQAVKSAVRNILRGVFTEGGEEADLDYFIDGIALTEVSEGAPEKPRNVTLPFGEGMITRYGDDTADLGVKIGDHVFVMDVVIDGESRRFDATAVGDDTHFVDRQANAIASKVRNFLQELGLSESDLAAIEENGTITISHDRFVVGDNEVNSSSDRRNVLRMGIARRVDTHHNDASQVVIKLIKQT